MSTIDVTGIWVGRADKDGDHLDVRAALQDRSSDLRGVLYFGDPVAGGLIDVGSIAGGRTDLAGNWGTPSGVKVSGTFAGDSFVGTLSIPRPGQADVQADLQLARAAQLLDGFVPIAPARLLDTRQDSSFPLDPGSKVDVAVTGRFGIPFDNVGAVVVNITGTGSSGPGYVTAWASGIEQPPTSNLNLEHVDQTAANLAVVPVGANGYITLFTQSGTHLVVDAFGWFSTTSILHLTATPTRVLDTRSPSPIGYHGPIPGPGAVVDVDLAVPGGLPSSGVAAAVVNITATAASGAGYVTAWPTGTAQPPTSNLNISSVGQTISNLAIVPVSTSSSLSLFTQAGTHLVVDVFGWFNLPATSSGPPLALGPDGNLVSDGSFEASASIPQETSYDTFPIGSVGSWTVVSGGVDVVGPGSATAYDGEQFVDLNGNGYGPGTIEQLVPTSADRQYRVSFFLAGNPNGDPQVKTLDVTFGDGKHSFSFDVSNQTNSNLGWTEKSFVANPDCGTSTVISLRSTTVGDKGPNIDAVRVVDAGPGSGCHIGGYRPIGPIRVFDTRPATQIGYTGDKPGPGAIVGVKIAGVKGITSGAIAAVAVNITATEAGGPGYVTSWASGTEQPATSNLNLEFVDQTRPNYAIVPVGADGAINLFTQAGSHLIVDVFGWFG